VVGPQHEFLVSLASCEPDALVHEAFAQSLSNMRLRYPGSSPRSFDKSAAMTWSRFAIS
jgi:hypothetical protein